LARLQQLTFNALNLCEIDDMRVSDVIPHIGADSNDWTMMSVGVAMVDVGQVFVLVAHCEMPMLGPSEHLDGVRSMVRIARIDRVRVLDRFVAVEVPVMAGCDHEHADERDGESNHRCRRQSVAVDWPRE